MLTMAHKHDIDVEYLHPADVTVVDFFRDDNGDLRLSAVVPCPECDQLVGLDSVVEATTDVDLELPLDDAEDCYD